ncbi:MAG: polynucleotide adenylyltransferase PcnB [Lentisphaeria bacterium]|nr:polynucleotide adenylyltransferase PcnB [Lentisphaeria bacterium]
MPIGSKVHPHVSKIVAQLNQHGYEAYLVGGAVRDILLGFQPKDYDMSTSATPEQIKKVFGRSARIIGRRFKLVHITFGRDLYEVSTFRRKPSKSERVTRPSDSGDIIWRDNEYGTMEEDAFRRDFTVNALYFNPLTEEIIDIVGGRTDLESGIVKVIGNADERLKEDPVRMIRALKLVAQYKFKLEPALDKSIKDLHEMLASASPARLFEEVMKVLHKAYALPTFKLLAQYNLLEILMPGFVELKGGSVAKEITDLLALRDERKLKGGFYSDSRVLALATLVFAPVRRRAIALTEEEGSLWVFKNKVDTSIRQHVFHLFDGLSMPKVIRMRLTSLLLTMPRFLCETKKSREILLNHKEYSYARELFSLWLTVAGLEDEGLLDNWPSRGRNPHRTSHSPIRQKPRRRRRAYPAGHKSHSNH